MYKIDLFAFWTSPHKPSGHCTYIVRTVRTMYVHCMSSARWEDSSLFISKTHDASSAKLNTIRVAGRQAVSLKVIIKVLSR